MTVDNELSEEGIIETELGNCSAKDVKIEEQETPLDHEPIRFDVTSFGWDSDVEGLVKIIIGFRSLDSGVYEVS